ncbi:hypothetical protein [Cumulibacter manganitolerans]|uniref:hypothetical protein n=1 Tax=Cumulibacter manganitolerans TaxID=1884992 RepID=UPI001295AF2D|nr:hypothetical protein [Cumulibacter manganitolerans]
MRASRLLAIGAAALAVAATPAAAHAAPGQDKPGHYQFAVIGDVPYGAAQLALFPEWIQEINAADPAMTFHVGDIKNGSTRCDDAYYTTIKQDFDQFANPLIYTPGDNEWTDCHRTSNGTYNPLERLAYDRSVFFSAPGVTLGQKPMAVTSQADRGIPENVSVRQQNVSFATLHVVGSNDGLLPWTELGYTSPTPEQVAEEQSRMAANLAMVRSTFDSARQRNDRAVVLMLQADMFDPTYDATWGDDSAFKPLVQELIDQANSFDGEVYLFNGDSHVYNSDNPLAPGSPWLSFYGVQGSTTNLQRVTVDGSSNNKDWLKVTVNRPNAEQVLSWERVPYAKQA